MSILRVLRLSLKVQDFEDFEPFSQISNDDAGVPEPFFVFINAK